MVNSLKKSLANRYILNQCQKTIKIIETIEQFNKTNLAERARDDCFFEEMWKGNSKISDQYYCFIFFISGKSCSHVHLLKTYKV